ncbi:regulatory protein GemA [Candidatus Accumulibacter contiguus]|jgi:hypothetical protein|uniref:regulatory protein GemA n=1 Tax=Candidatus Accumulibacter contiguus TaxID=2954381 RepID=UPI002FC3563C
MSTTTPEARKPGSTRGQLLARLHCIKHERTWSDDEYRDILQGVSGKRSAADLDFAGLARAVAVLGGKPVRVAAADVAGGHADDPRFRTVIAQASADKKPLLRKIAAVCGALGANAAYAEGIAKRHSGGVDRRLEMCSYEELYKIAQALVNTQRARQKGREVPA